MAHTVRFDESLREFCSVIVRLMGPGRLAKSIVIRDASGRLCLCSTEVLSPEDISAAETKLRGSGLGAYLPESRIVFSSDDPGSSTLLKDAEHLCIYEEMHLSGVNITVKLLDRRIVGNDWLHKPSPESATPPRMVFFSFKGGVGRSTALAVLAADLARDSHNVLVIDLDLEAPGLGSVLLSDDSMPSYGALDYFVENALGGASGDFMDQMVGTSHLVQGTGLVDVVPALGKSAAKAPQNVLAKLARAYMEDPSPQGPKSFLAQARSMVDALCLRKTYSAVLIDTRAGLNESSAASLLGLGADVLLFGVDTPQTFEGYRYLLAHLAQLVTYSPADEWRWRLRTVHAKADASPEHLDSFRYRAFEIFSETLYDELIEEASSSEAFSFDAHDEAAPHYAWPILNSDTFRHFNPLEDHTQLTDSVYAAAFGSFLTQARDLLGLRKDK